MIAPASADHKLRHGYLQDKSGLTFRMVALATMTVVAMPVAILGLLLYSLLRHVGEARASGDYFGPRRWSPWALWRMRETNELPHALEMRAGPAAVHADRYMAQFQSPYLAAISRAIAFVASALLACALLPSLISNRLAISLYVPAGGFSLVWYAAILATVVAAARALIPGHASAWLDPVGAMRNVAAYFHRVPPHWLPNAKHAAVREQLGSQFYKHKLWLLLSEIGSVLCMPVLLAAVLPRDAPRLA